MGFPRLGPVQAGDGVGVRVGTEHAQFALAGQDVGGVGERPVAPRHGGLLGARIASGWWVATQRAMPPRPVAISTQAAPPRISRLGGTSRSGGGGVVPSPSRTVKNMWASTSRVVCL